MLTVEDYTDIGILIAFALQPTKRPSNEDYRRTLGRYRGELAFREAVDGILDGLSAKVLSDNDYGLVLGVHAESPFAFRSGDMPRTQDAENRVLAALVLVGLAAFIFPSAEDLEEDRVRQVQEMELEQWLRARCKQLQSKDTAGEVIPEEGLDHAWRIYEQMEAVKYNARGRTAGGLSSTCTLYWVHNTITWLAEQGMARPDNTVGDGGWLLTERFRIQVRNMGAGSAYEYLRELDRAAATVGQEDRR